MKLWRRRRVSFLLRLQCVGCGRQYSTRVPYTWPCLRLARSFTEYVRSYLEKTLAR